MTSPLQLVPLEPADGADYGLARVRDIAFDAVQKLWKRREAEGMTQKQVATRIGANFATISRNLKAPGNWTLRTLGELVYALDGDITITVLPHEDVVKSSNYDFYDELFDDNSSVGVEFVFSPLTGPSLKSAAPDGSAPKIKTEMIV